MSRPTLDGLVECWVTQYIVWNLIGHSSDDGLRARSTSGSTDEPFSWFQRLCWDLYALYRLWV